MLLLACDSPKVISLPRYGLLQALADLYSCRGISRQVRPSGHQASWSCTTRSCFSAPGRSCGLTWRLRLDGWAASPLSVGAQCANSLWGRLAAARQGPGGWWQIAMHAAPPRPSACEMHTHVMGGDETWGIICTRRPLLFVVLNFPTCPRLPNSVLEPTVHTL